MTVSTFRKAPEPTVRRLPDYYHYLKWLLSTGREVVSCTHIARDLDLDPTQVRKDLAATGIRGKPKVGYLVLPLIASIENFLGWNNTNDAFLAGAGSMGTALLGYEGFKQYGLNIVAAFDTDEKKVGEMVHGREILSLEKLPNLAVRMHIQLGVLAVPATAAQEVAELMVEGGIAAIWNFAPVTLDLPEGIIVQNENLAASLAVLSRQLSESRDAGAKFSTRRHVRKEMA